MAQTLSQQNERTLMWLKFFHDLQKVHTGALVKLEHYVWHLPLDQWPEHNPYLTKLASENPQAIQAKYGTEQILLRVDKPRLRPCPQPDAALLPWLKPHWDQVGKLEAATYTCAFKVKLKLKGAMPDVVMSTPELADGAELSAAEFSFLTGQSAYVGSPAKATLDPDTKLIEQECVRYTSNPDWIKALEALEATSHDLVLECQHWSEQSALNKTFTAWQRQRQVWQQSSQSEFEAAQIYSKLQLAYTTLQQASGEAELLLANGLLRALNPSEVTITSSNNNLALDASKELFGDTDSADAKSDAEGNAEASAAGRNAELAGRLMISHPLVLRPIRLSFDERLEQFTIYDSAAHSQLYTPALQALESLLDSAQVNGAAGAGGGVTTSGAAATTTTTESAEPQESTELDLAADEWQDLSTQAQAVHPLDRSKLVQYLELLGTLIPRCLVTPQVSTDLTLLEHYFCMLSLGPCLVIRSFVPQVQTQLDALSDFVSHGGTLSDPAYRLLNLGPAYERTELFHMEPTKPSLQERLYNLSCERPKLLLNHPLNPQQQVLLEKAESQPIVLAQAPIGTGKSYTAAALVAQAMAQGKRVLVTSQRSDVLDSVASYLSPALCNLCGQLGEAGREAIAQTLTAFKSFQLEASQQQIESLQVKRNEVFNELLAQRIKLFNWLNSDNVEVVYQGQSYNCTQLHDFVREHSHLATVIPFTPQVEKEAHTTVLTGEDGAPVDAEQTEVDAAAAQTDQTDADQSPDSTSESSEKASRSQANVFALHDFPLTMGELKELYESNESLPAQYEDQLKLAWPELRTLPQPEQFLDLLQSLSKLQQSLDHAQAWQLELNLAQDLVCFKARTPAAKAILGTNFELHFAKFNADKLGGVLIGQLPEIPTWIAEVFRVGQNPSSPQFKPWQNCVQKLLTLHNLYNKLSPQLEGRKVDLHPQFATNLQGLQQLDSALQCAGRYAVQVEEAAAAGASGAAGSAASATAGQASAGQATAGSAEGAGEAVRPEQFKSACALIDRALRINKQTIRNKLDLACALDYVRWQITKLQCIQLWQTVVAPVSHVSFESLDPDNPEKLAWRFGYLLHWVLYWRCDRQGLQNFWQGKFQAAGLEVALNFQHNDPKSQSLQGAVMVWHILQQAGQELGVLSQQAQRYYRYCLNYNRVLKLLGQEQFQANPCCCLLLQALSQRQPPLYAKAYRQMRQVLEYQPQYQRRSELLKRIAEFAPEWSDAIAHRRGVHGKTTVPEHVEQAWQYWQFAQCLSELTSNSPHAIKQQLTPLKHKFYEVSSQYIEQVAQHKVLAAVNPEELKAAGVGLGGTASELTSSLAQWPMLPHSKTVAFDLLPAWLLPLSYVLNYSSLLRTRFDLLIVDEAQSLNLSAAAVLLFNLADHVVLLGDEQQLKLNYKALSAQAAPEQSELLNRLQLSILEQAHPQLLEFLATSNARECFGHLSSGQYSLFAWLQHFMTKLQWSEQFTAVAPLLKWTNEYCYEGKLHGLRLPRFSTLAPALMMLHGGDKALSILIAVLKACCEQNEYASRTMGIMVLGEQSAQRHCPSRAPAAAHADGTDSSNSSNSPDSAAQNSAQNPAQYAAQNSEQDAAPSTDAQGSEDEFTTLEQLSHLVQSELSVSLCKQHQLRFGTAASFSGCSRDVMFVLVGEQELGIEHYNMAMAHTTEQVWLINTAPLSSLAETDIRYQLLSYAEHIQSEFAQDLKDLPAKDGAEVGAGGAEAGAEAEASSAGSALLTAKAAAHAAPFLIQSLGQDQTLKPEQISFLQQLVQALSELGFQLLLSTQRLAPTADLASSEDPTGLVVVYQQRRLRLECHIEKDLTHPESIVEILQRHERYEHYGYSVLHVMCTALNEAMVEALAQQLQREGFQPENLRSFIYVLLHQTSVVLLHKIQERALAVLAESFGITLENNSLFSGVMAQSLLKSKSQAALAAARKAMEQQGAGAGAAGAAANGGAGSSATSLQQLAQDLSDDDLEDADGDVDGEDENAAAAAAEPEIDPNDYADYVAPDQSLTSELERVITQSEQEQAEAAYREGPERNRIGQKEEAETELKYNYQLARLGLKHIAQPIQMPLPADPHERFRAFKRFLFGMLRQMRLSYMDLLSSYQIVAVTPNAGQTQYFLRLCEYLHLRPYIYNSSKPMAKRVWCIKQADLMSAYVHESAVALCSKAPVGSAEDENAGDTNESELQYAERQRYDYAYQNRMARRIPPMAEGDANSPLIAALNKAMNPYWGQTVAEQQLNMPQTMRALEQRGLAQSWEPPRSTNQFLREQLMPPPMRRNLNRGDVNTLAVLSMIPKDQGLPNPSKAKLHTLRVTNGKGQSAQSDKPAARHGASNYASAAGSRSAQAHSSAVRSERQFQQQQTEQEQEQEQLEQQQQTAERNAAPMSDSHLQAAVQQLEQAKRQSDNGEIDLSSIFDIPELSTAVSASLAAASNMISTQEGDKPAAKGRAQAGVDANGLVDPELFAVPKKESKAYPVYGAGAAANSRLKRAGAVDYPGMPHKPAHSHAADSQADATEVPAKAKVTSKAAASQSVEQAQATLARAQGADAGTGAGAGAGVGAAGMGLVHGQDARFNADAAVAELLFQYEQEQGQADRAAGGAPEGSSAGGAGTAASSAPNSSNQDNVVVRGSILGLGEIEGAELQPAYAPAPAAVPSPVAAPAPVPTPAPMGLGRGRGLSTVKNQVNAASLAGAQALSQAAYGGGNYRGQGAQSHVPHGTNAPVHSPRAGLGGGYGSKGMAVNQGALSQEQMGYLSMLLQRSQIWFKQEGTVLRVKVLPSQDVAFKDICKAMKLKPQLRASSQGAAHYSEWTF